jgi:hypothetical protein
MILAAPRGHPASRVVASNDLRISAQVYYSNPTEFIKWEDFFSGAAPPSPRFFFTNYLGLL